MKIPNTALFSVVLLAASVGAMAIPTVNVNVANFPLDEQGNLKVSSPTNTEVITVFKDLPVSFVKGITTVYSSELIEVGEFSEIYVYVNFGDWTTAWSPYQLDVGTYLFGFADDMRSSQLPRARAKPL